MWLEPRTGVLILTISPQQLHSLHEPSMEYHPALSVTHCGHDGLVEHDPGVPPLLKS